ncbi:ring canal kelch homolog isoform X3 [Rhopalosiphum padi]|uniref:ring canal kelch homolog isoform X3 n=1 Tax=Rhopalosiphum padi TaxID=40932 RepID=UPI00298DB14A|nr:ring canal kelch homolog isoform X3 [Rhopalosiphum padi]
MSVKEMDPAQKLVLKSNKCEPEHFKNSSHKDRVFEVLQSSRNQDDNFCDIKLLTDDGTIVFGHKSILASATPYFKAMFSSFAESNKDLVIIRKLDSTILQLLIDYIYTGEIMITQEIVQVVLPAADLFQLDYVKQVCIDFLQKQLDPSNCLSIKAFADLHNCIELLSSCEAHIKKQFLKVVEHDEFLSLSSGKVIKLISCNDINVPFEEKVFECVIKWVKHEFKLRRWFLPNLMEHVRLPLISKEYLLEKVVDEPLLKNNSICKNYVFEALRFSLIKLTNTSSIPQTIWSKPRLQQQVILVLGWSDFEKKNITNWYEPATNLMHIAPKMIKSRDKASLCVVKDQFVFAISGYKSHLLPKDNFMLDISSSSCWVRRIGTLVSRINFGIGVLDNCIYAIGGLNLKSVECYDPSLDKWNPVAEMSNRRYNHGVGVLDGIMYAIGGTNGTSLKSVEAYSPTAGVWSSIADMNLYRENPGVVAYDGLLYVFGGSSNLLNIFDISSSVEIYNPRTNSWLVKTISISHRIYGAVVVNRPPYLQTN